MMILARVAQQEHPHLVPGRTILVVGMDIIIMTTHEQPLQRHTSLFLFCSEVYSVLQNKLQCSFREIFKMYRFRKFSCQLYLDYT